MGIGPFRTFEPAVMAELALRTELVYSAERCAADPLTRLGEAMFQLAACATLQRGDRDALARMWSRVDAR